MRALAALPLLFSAANAFSGELTDKDFKSKTDGKNGFYFFQAPW